MTAAEGTAAWMGIDLGTQSVRVVVVDDAGTTLGSATAPLTSVRKGNRHEQDPEHWWGAVVAAARGALAGVPGVPVRGVAVDGTSGTILLADGHGNPLTPGLMYDDGRAHLEADRVNDTGGPTWAALGYQRMQPSWALPKLIWLQANHAVLVKAPDTQLMHQADFINRRLAGHNIPTDLSNALKTGVHLIEESWPEGLLETLGVPRSVLPPLVRSGTVIGSVGGDAAAQTGIPAGTPVVSGATDGCAAQIGAGALTTGDWNSVVGTTLILKGVSDTLLQDPLGVVYSHKGPDGRWLPGGASSSGAGLIARDLAGRDLATLEEAARAVSPGTVITYPLVSPGERFPFAAPEAREFTIGVPGSDAERYAGILQGLAYIERLCFDYLTSLGATTSGRLTLTGGATKSRYWSQLRADVLGRTVELPDNSEPALGMAILAAAAVSGRSAAEVAAGMVSIRNTIDPRPEYADRFGPGYLMLVDGLEERGWLNPHTATYARSNL